MEEFAEMLNLFILLCHGLALISALLLTDFINKVVYDSIRLRGKTWMVAHEMFLIILRRVEDSGGTLLLAKACDEVHLTSVIEEAEIAAVKFFLKSKQGGMVVHNGKFNPNGRPCKAFNEGGVCTELYSDGTCKFNHVCDHWVSKKGKNGRCLGPDHPRFKCNNPDRCDEPVA